MTDEQKKQQELKVVELQIKIQENEMKRLQDRQDEAKKMKDSLETKKTELSK